MINKSLLRLPPNWKIKTNKLEALKAKFIIHLKCTKDIAIFLKITSLNRPNIFEKMSSQCALWNNFRVISRSIPFHQHPALSCWTIAYIGLVEITLVLQFRCTHYVPWYTDIRGNELINWLIICVLHQSSNISAVFGGWTWNEHFLKWITRWIWNDDEMKNGMGHKDSKGQLV